MPNEIPSGNEVPPIPQEAADDDPPHHCRSPSPDQSDENADQDIDPAISPPHTPPRQQGHLPSADQQPPPPPRKSGRERKVPLKPSNIYGERRNPVEIVQEDRHRALGRGVGPSRLGNGKGWGNPCGSRVWVRVRNLVPASFKTSQRSCKTDKN